MKLKNIAAVAAAAAMLMPAAVNADDSVKVYIAGDSTACNYGEDENYALPRGGWGMYLGKYIDGAEVINCAKSGRSSKSLVAEDEYKEIMDNIKEGDYLLIQFGHNDAKNSSDEDKQLRYTDPEGDKDTEGSFKNSLYVNYIKPAQEKGAHPILLTPISRRKFGDDGMVTDSHGLYDDDVRELAEELDIPCLDMTKTTENLYNMVGEEGSKDYHAIFKDTSKGFDNTHLNRMGAEYIAAFVTEELRLKDSDGLGAYVDTDVLSVLAREATRGEFTAQIVRLMGIEASGSDNFGDVASDDENYAAISTAKAAGIVCGNEKGEFKPDDPLTLQDMAVITARALEKAGVLEIKESGSASNIYSGAQEPSTYAAAAMDTLIDNNIIVMGETVAVGTSAPKAPVDNMTTADIFVKAYSAKVDAEQAASKEMSIDELEKVE